MTRAERKPLKLPYGRCLKFFCLVILHLTVWTVIFYCTEECLNSEDNNIGVAPYFNQCLMKTLQRVPHDPHESATSVNSDLFNITNACKKVSLCIDEYLKQMQTDRNKCTFETNDILKWGYYTTISLFGLRKWFYL